MCFGDWSRTDLFSQSEFIHYLESNGAVELPGEDYVDDDVLLG